MRSQVVELGDDDIALFLRDGLDGGAMLQKLGRGGTAQAAEWFPNRDRQTVKDLLVAVKELSFDENDALYEELVEELQYAAVELGQRIQGTNNEKFFTEKQLLIFGQPKQAALGLAHYMCVDETALLEKMHTGEQSIIEEIETFGTDEVTETRNPKPETRDPKPGRRPHSFWCLYCV